MWLQVSHLESGNLRAPTFRGGVCGSSFTVVSHADNVCESAQGTGGAWQEGDLLFVI